MMNDQWARDSIYTTLRRRLTRYKEPAIKLALVAGMTILVAGSIYKPLGDLVEGVRFAGPALFLGVGFLLFDSITSERKGPEDEQGLVVERPAHLHSHIGDVFKQ